MERDDITIGFVGAGGDGVVAAGEILANSAASNGLHCMMVKSFGPQIRGGESSCRIRLSSREVYSQGNGLNVLACFNWNDYLKFSGELEVEEDVVIIMDEADSRMEDELPVKGGKKRRVINVPFARLSAEAGSPKGRNMVMLGVLAELFKLSGDGLVSALKKRFAEKDAGVSEANLKALSAGMDFARSNFPDFDIRFVYKKGKPRMLLTGNEAVAFGALASGCRFYSSYPITPASEIMEYLSAEMPKFGGVVVQAEDEISAACMVTGAAYGGVKAMTATSGPGLSLKLETIGLGTMAELPYVVVNVQRGGPSTGMPTKSEQADLFQAVYGMHGDAPHAVLAVSDVEDCFKAVTVAFDIAERYQMPVILLSDQHLGHRSETVRGLDFESVTIAEKLVPRRLSKGGYRRFVDTPDGISPMTWPGIPAGEYLCSGIEHDEDGSPSSEYEVHEKMVAKRFKKLLRLEKEFGFIRYYGVKNPEVGIVTWGSNKGIVREAAEYFVSKGLSVGAIVPQLIYPLQKAEFYAFFKGLKALLVVEQSFGGQFLGYLRSQLDLPEKVMHLKSAGGKAYAVRDVINEIDKAF